MNKLTNFIFGTILSVLLLTNIFLPKATYSFMENRKLAALPKFSINDLMAGRFTANFESYIQDHIIGRDNWIILKTELEKLSGKTENNGVYFGKDDYYFEVKTSYNDRLLNRNIGYLNKLTEISKEYGINVAFLNIYTSFTFYQDKMPANTNNIDELEISQILANGFIDLPIIDSYDVLKEHLDEDIYFKTDHHWTILGAYYAYTELCKHYGFEPLALEDYEKIESDKPFYGTLYSKAPLLKHPGDHFYTLEDGNSYTVTILDDNTTHEGLYYYEHYDEKDQYVTYLNGNHGVVNIKNNDLNNGRKLVIFKDSFSHALVPFIASHFEEIVMLDPRYMPDNYTTVLEKYEPTDVLFSYNVSWFADDKNIYNLTR